MSWLAIALGFVIAGLGIAWSIAQASGGQPWDPELSDNVIFAKSLPLILGFGILTGFARALADRGGTERRSDGAIRRFHPVTVFNHWINAIGFLLAMVTGSIQYLRGVLDVPTPIPLFWVYRIHFLAASLIVFAAALFVTHRLITGDRRLLPPPGQWIRHLRGLAHELPHPLVRPLAVFLGLDMKRQPPAVGQFTYYEKVVSFPIWTTLLALIAANPRSAAWCTRSSGCFPRSQNCASWSPQVSACVVVMSTGCGKRSTEAAASMMQYASRVLTTVPARDCASGGTSSPVTTCSRRELVCQTMM